MKLNKQIKVLTVDRQQKKTGDETIRHQWRNGFHTLDSSQVTRRRWIAAKFHSTKIYWPLKHTSIE